MDHPLRQIRRRIDDVDRRIVDALIDRLNIVQEASEYKAACEEPVRDPEREQGIVDRLSTQAEAAGLDADLVEALYQVIFDFSVQMQRESRNEAARNEHVTEPEEEQAPRPHRNGTLHRAEPAFDLSDKPYRKASRAHQRTDTVVRVGDLAIGGDGRVLIGGPCSVESREQVMACAETVRQAGGHILRGGCFKPRTSPYSFQGLGYEGLDLLAEAGRTHGLPIVSEVMAPEDVGPVAEKADILQIGARNMQNYPLLEAVGRSHRPVMLKRGMTATVDEWLGAAEYILAEGNGQVILCQRGIRTFEQATRYTLDLTALPVVRERTHLPVIVDPSHAAGTRRWVPSLAEGALAAGANGVMVEMHPNPAEALSDGPQSLTFDQFREMAARLQPLPQRRAA